MSNEVWVISDTLGKTTVMALRGKSVSITNCYRDPVILEDRQSRTIRFDGAEIQVTAEVDNGLR